MSAPPPPQGQPQRPIRTSSLASDLGLYTPQRATTLEAPADNPLVLTPLRAHYLKRELVTLEFIEELNSLSSPTSLSLLGSPFLPASRFINGVAQPPPAAGSPEAIAEARVEEEHPDLPFLRFVLHHFILTFPFLANCPPTFFSHKLQPFIYSFVSRNISSSSVDADEGGRDDETKRRRLAGKVEKHLGLILSAAIKVTENDGREEVVRVEDDGAVHTAMPASQQSKYAQPTRGHAPAPGFGGTRAQPKQDPAFDINIVSVRNKVTKGKLRNKSHEEFIIRTRRKGQEDLFVARRYGDFTRLAQELRAECIEEDIRSPPPKDRRSTSVPSNAGSSSPRPSTDSPSSSSSPSSPSTPTFDPSHIPSLARERNRLTLRAYLRTLLLNPALGSSSAYQSFLLESPIELTSSERRDVSIREEMDRLREEELKSFRGEVEARVKELEGYLRGFREELVQTDGLSRVFKEIREKEKVEDLPIQYRKVMEWARISLASTVYQLFLGSDNSSSTFASLKRMHGIMPYFMLRGILRISNPVAMVRSVLDLFLARPFGSTSLLQKLFSSGLTEEARELRDDSELVARKIADDRLVDKVQEFVDAPKEVQNRFRQEAAAENLDIMTVILRSSSPTLPLLDPRTIQHIQRCAIAYEEYKHERDELSDPDDDEGPDNDEAWVFEDLHVLLRILTKARDKEQLIELIFEGSTSEVLKDIVTIFYEPLAKVYKAANIADSLSDLQAFINDLIKTVELAEDANLTDPQRTVQIFVDLVARHEDRFYHFVHQVHSKGEGLFDNLMKWIELFINFVRDGLPSPVSLDFLLPVGGQERKDIIAEVDQVIEYHRKLKQAHHDRMRKRMLKGKETDADADAEFVAGVMDNLHIGSLMGDVADVTAERSDEEAEEDDEGSSDDASEEEVPDHGVGPDGAPRRPLPPLPGEKPSVLQPIPRGSGRGKKDRAPIDPPKLKLVPSLVPIFVELVRGELNNARRAQRGLAPPPPPAH